MFGRRMDGSRTLTLGGNNLKGRIPSEVGDLTGMVELWLYGNDLT